MLNRIYTAAVLLILTSSVLMAGEKTDPPAKPDKPKIAAEQSLNLETVQDLVTATWMWEAGKLPNVSLAEIYEKAMALDKRLAAGCPAEQKQNHTTCKLARSDSPLSYGCELDRCSIKVKWGGNGRWGGRVSCQDGFEQDFEGNLGAWIKVTNSKTGAQWSVRAVDHQLVGLLQVEFLKK